MNKSHRGEKCFADIVSAVYAFGGPVVGLQIWDKHGFNPLSIVTVCVCVCVWVQLWSKLFLDALRVFMNILRPAA